MRAALGVVADICCVLAFVVIGRANHHAGETLAGVASTAWPFLAGLAAGEVATHGWRRPHALVPTGTGVWLATVAIGQLLRVLARQGTTGAFAVVSLLFLGLFLLGWRLVLLGWRLAARRVFPPREAGLGPPPVPGAVSHPGRARGRR